MSDPPFFKVMGILNVTPDSFSDGGRFIGLDTALAHAAQMVEEGADFIDVGGESTRPGATPVPLQQELDRVIPVIEAIKTRFPVTLSVDTSKPEVMAAAVAAGAGFINDVRALEQPGALVMASDLAVPVCLMHHQGEPGTMQDNPCYQDVVVEVKIYLQQRVQACLMAGIPADRLVIDPGFGFGKTLEHNLQLLNHLPSLHALGLPILVGLSRKSLIGKILGVAPSERIHGSLALAVIAAWQGAAIFRVHDVAPTVQALQLCQAVRGG